MAPLAFTVGSHRHSREELCSQLVVLSIKEESCDPVLAIVVVKACLRMMVSIGNRAFSNIEPEEGIAPFDRLIDYNLLHSTLLAKNER